MHGRVGLNAPAGSDALSFPPVHAYTHMHGHVGLNAPAGSDALSFPPMHAYTHICMDM